MYICTRKKVANSGCSVARLSRRVWDAEVAGSNPATPTSVKPSLSVDNEGFSSLRVAITSVATSVNNEIMDQSQLLCLRKYSG